MLSEELVKVGGTGDALVARFIRNTFNFYETHVTPSTLLLQQYLYYGSDECSAKILLLDKCDLNGA
jgi:hypothetical protein